ncbi:MAG: NADH-quinone oxidoreductase subunit E [Rhodobacterales bacterium 32-66-7]|nr:MAG: NADH-quinone oxidoreductase subunit E [Rhodobacterales bacterium 32-66-7]
MLRRLHKDQPESFAFTPANLAWARGQISKYPEGWQASAIIPLLWRAQEQEGWLSRPAIEHVADMLGMAYIRALEVATFYFMFQLQPVGSVAHVQVCGTTSCMICGAEDLVAVCKELIAKQPHTLSDDGKFSWEEVECLGACANAPMAQIGKDYYEDLTPEKLRHLIAAFSHGEIPVPGPQNGRYAAEPAGGLTSLTDFAKGRARYNASAQAAVDLADTVRRIDGTEAPLTTPWVPKPDAPQAATGTPSEPKPGAGAVADATGVTVQEAPAVAKGRPKPSPAAEVGVKPATLDAPRGGTGDDLTLILGVGTKLAALCHKLGVYHFDQIAAWTPDEIAWVDANLQGFKGRVSRDKWVVQAKVLAAGGSAADAEAAARAAT